MGDKESIQSTNSTIKCPLCSRTMEFAGDAGYYDLKSKFRTPMYHCRCCDIYYRHIDRKKMLEHCYAAIYVKPENEQRYFYARRAFFDFILSLIEKHFADKRQTVKTVQELKLVDFGSAYGHLLKIAQDKGFNAIGVELNENMVELCKKKGLVVYKQLSELSGQADVFTLIDSLYCVSNVKELMMQIKQKLQTNGIIVVRITNRNWYAGLKRMIMGKIDLSLLGDAMISYSLNGLRKLLSDTGFEILKIIPDRGIGKRKAWRKKAFYLISYFFTLLVGKLFIFTPGIIVIAGVKKNS